VRLNLVPGDYIAVCFVPDAQGAPHAALGRMRRALRVRHEAHRDV